MPDRVLALASSRAVVPYALALLILWVALQTVPAHAQEHVELPPELDARAAALYVGIMCPQCDGQTISQSNAQIAATMRQMVRERLRAGDSDDDIYDFMVLAFGESILASPPTSGVALTVWVVPPIGFLLGAIAVIIVVRRLQRDPEDPALATAPPGTEHDLDAYLDLVDNEMQEGPTRG